MSLDQVLVPGSYGDKDIVVVPADCLRDLVGEGFSGVKDVDEQELFELLKQDMELRPRGDELEQDRSYKQVIPYFLVRQAEGDQYLTACRRGEGGQSTEIRLHEKRIIGFGGHLKASDVEGPMHDWLTTEFLEEISGAGVEQIRFLGIVDHNKDDDNGVHLVHVGLVFEVTVTGDPKIAEPDNFRDEALMSLDVLESLRDEMELWSRLVLDFLLRR